MEIYAVEKSLKKISLKAKILLVLYGIFKICAYAFLLSVISFVIDYYIPDIPRYVRFIMFLIILYILAVLAYRYIVKTIVWRPSSSFLAGVVELHFKEFNDVLISAVDFARRVAKGVKSESQTMMMEVIKLAIKSIKDKPLTKVINIKPLLRAYMYGIICIVISGYTISTFPEYVNIWFKRLIGGSVKWPQKTILELVEPQPKPNTNIVSVGMGDRLKLVARAVGVPVSKVLLYIRHTEKEGEQPKEEFFYMNRLLADENRNKFVYELVNVNKNFEFYFKSQDIVSGIYKVEVFPYPQIEEITYKITYPAYSNQAPAVIKNTRTIPVQIGSYVDVIIKANVPLWSGVVEFEALPENDYMKKVYLYPYTDLYTISGRFLAKKTSEFSITLNSRDGKNNKEQYVFALNVSEDLPPLANITYPQKSLKYMTRGGKLPIWLEAKDDYGIQYITMSLKKTDERGVYTILKRIRTPKKNKRVVKKVVLSGVKLKGRFKIKEDDTIEASFSVWDNCKFDDYAFNKEMKCPHKVTTETKRVQIISASEFEKRVDDIIADLKEKIIKLKEGHENILGELGKISTKVPEGIIYNFLFKEPELINETVKVREELYDIYSDVVNNRLYSDSKVIPTKLRDAYILTTHLVGKRGTQNEGLLNDILRDLRVINEMGKIRDVKRNLDNAISLYYGILALLEEWESYQGLIRDVKRIKEGVLESQKKLKEWQK